MSWGIFLGIVGGLGIVVIYLIIISSLHVSANADESSLVKGIKHLRLAMNLMEKELDEHDWEDLDNLVIKLETKERTKNGELD